MIEAIANVNLLIKCRRVPQACQPCLGQFETLPEGETDTVVKLLSKHKSSTPKAVKGTTATAELAKRLELAAETIITSICFILL